MPVTALRDLLGPAAPDPDELRDVARAALGRPRAEPVTWSVQQLDHEIGTFSTAALVRVRGTAVDGGATLHWSSVGKAMRSYAHMPLPAGAPAAVRARAAGDVTWRHELDVYADGLDGVLPAGMRLPRRHLLRDLGDGRGIVWLEDVRRAAVAWDRRRFARAARLLGRLAARLSRAALPGSVFSEPGLILRLQDEKRQLLDVPALRDDDLWRHPLLRADARLRDDLHRLDARVPALLDALGGLPQAHVHGDASPQNLLVPTEDPSGFVVIDWSLMGPAAVGYDLGQLLVGLVHAGELDVAALPELTPAVVAAYTAGLADEGRAVDPAAVGAGLVGTLAVRSAFCALPLARLTAEPPSPGLARLVADRLRLARYLVDLGLALPV